MWAQHLRNEAFPVVEFNAWETDHADDPLVALASELKDGLSEFADGSFRERIKETTEAAKQVALRAIPGVIRILTAGLLDVQASIGTEVGKLLASYAERSLEKYREDQESIKSFRQKLHVMANELSLSRNHPLMIFIDELDRCRPSYAIALIEVAKHLFGVDGVVFVLAVNRTQLAHSISALYGSKFDATGYLRRFVDIDFRLPEPDRTKFVRDMLNRIQFQHDGALLKKFFGRSDFSLRQVGQAVNRIGIVAASTQNARLVMMMEAALIVRTIDSDHYHQFVQGNLSDMELVDATYARVDTKDYYFEALIVVAAREIACDRNNQVYDRSIESPLINRYQEEAHNREENQSTGHAEYVIEVVQRLEQRGNYFGTVTPGFLEAVRRIELLVGTERRE